MHKLIIEDDEGRTTVVPLVREELSIGRKEGNAIRLTERNISRRHARLLTTDGSVVIEDLASYTGVRVNGVRIEVPTPVRDGDQVTIGDYKLSVKLDGVEIHPLSSPRMPEPNETATVPDVAAAARASAPTEAPPPPDGAPAALSDAAPTIPLRTLVESNRQSDRQRTPPARLVAVTTSLGGMEFRLDRPSLVIGRTEENDIILNHPSISRHHAKIVRDGERYTVVDLQSANGVRVGGETYDRVDVQPGDVIELGHVKLRLVGPAETWTYDPKEFAASSRRLLKLGGIGGGVAVVAVAVLLMVRKGSGPQQAEPEAAQAAQAQAAPKGPTPEQYFERASAAVKAEKWDDAVTALDLLLNTGPNDEAEQALRERASGMKKQVDLERRSAELYAEFDEAAKAKEPDVALTRFEAIPAASMYKGRAEAALPDIKAQFIEAHLDLADAARAQGRCDDAREEIQKVEQEDPDNRQAHDILKACRTKPVAHVAIAAAPAPRPAVAPKAHLAAAHPTPAKPAVPFVDEFAPPPDPPADAAELIHQARTAWLHQQCSQAIELSRRALKLKGNANDAHQIIAVCSCSTKDRDSALKSYQRLDERNRGMVRSACSKYGIDLEE